MGFGEKIWVMCGVGVGVKVWICGGVEHGMQGASVGFRDFVWV